MIIGLHYIRFSLVYLNTNLGQSILPLPPDYTSSSDMWMTHLSLLKTVLRNFPKQINTFSENIKFIFEKRNEHFKLSLLNHLGEGDSNGSLNLTIYLKLIHSNRYVGFDSTFSFIRSKRFPSPGFFYKNNQDYNYRKEAKKKTIT